MKSLGKESLHNYHGGNGCGVFFAGWAGAFGILGAAVPGLAVGAAIIAAYGGIIGAASCDDPGASDPYWGGPVTHNGPR